MGTGQMVQTDRAAALVHDLRREGARVATYRSGEVVFDPALDTKRVAIVCTGRATVFRMSPQGRQVATSILSSGDWIENIFPSETHERTFIQSDSQVTLAWFDPVTFVRVVRKYPEFGLEMIRGQVRRLADVEIRTSQSALDTVAGTVALAILQMAEREGRTEIRVTHEELAQRLGTVRESVSLAISKLRRAGALAPASNRKRLIEILSLPKLEQFVASRASGT